MTIAKQAPRQTQAPQVVEVLSHHPTGRKMMAKVNIAGQICTKHLHRTKTGGWAYCSSQLQLEAGDPLLTLQAIAVPRHLVPPIREVAKPVPRS